MVIDLKNKNKQTLALSGIVIIMIVVLIGICSFMMPDVPQYTIKKEDPTAETSKNSQKVVMIDPGHGGYDDGSLAVDGSLEKNINLEISLKIQQLLEEENIQVLLTRVDDKVSWPNDNVADLDARLNMAKDANAVALVSIHCNFSEEDPEHVRGSEIYVNSEQEDSVILATAIHDQLETLKKKLPSRQLRYDPLHLTVHNQIPTVIVEMGFISNKTDTAFLTNEKTQDEISQAIAKGIIYYINEK